MPKGLTTTEVAALTKDGTWHVGNGLYLQQRNGGRTRSWLLKYMRQGKVHWMGLGPTRLVPLTKARAKATAAQAKLLDGIDPIEARRKEQRATGMTFAEATEGFIKAHQAGWSNPKHRWQVRHWMESYAWPTIGKLPVASVDANHVVAILEPIWTTKSETASRVRNYIERILDWAKVAGHRSGDNPAKWRGGIQHRLPPLSRVQKIEHHVAVPYADAPEVYAKLAALGDRRPALALRFIALTASRAGEVLGATWQEFDLDHAVWNIPAERMKARKAHRVPLSGEALAVLRLARGDRDVSPTDLAFRGLTRTKRMSDTALRKLLRQVGPSDADTHGWRSTFRDWAAEKTSYPREVAEAALAHTLGNKVEVAYLRSDLFDQRAKLMADWGDFLHGAED